MGVNENPNNTKSATVEGRKKYYDWLAQQITIDGIIAVERDTDFDDDKYYRSGGIRLRYESVTGPVEGMKEGILLEAGFSQVTPNTPMTISSWAYDEAARHNIELIDNRAVDVPCYHIGFTFIEKLQTIATKFRQEQQDGISRPNVMRQYYDVHKLLGQQTVQDFIGSDEYAKHKKDWFPLKDYAIPIRENEAFLLHSRENRAAYKKRYEKTAALYYKGQPSFETVLATIQQHLDRL